MCSHSLVLLTQRALSLVKPVDQVVIAEDTEHVGAAEDVAPEDG